MFETNEYFEGKVKSIAFSAAGEDATIGVMGAGEYEFATNRQETMQVISGGLTIRMPGESSWQRFGPGEQFVVEANQSFGVKVDEDSSYLCIYR